MLHNSMIKLKGTCLTHGTAYGKAYLYNQIDLDVLRKNKFVIKDIMKEEQKLETALAESRKQLEHLEGEVTKAVRKDFRNIFLAHKLLLEDQSIIDGLRKKVRIQKINIEYLLAKKIQEIENKFTRIEDVLLRSRLTDIQDVYSRLLRNMLQIEHVQKTSLSRIKEPSVLVTPHLVPSEFVTLCKSNLVKGIVIENCSNTSHIAIMAKSMNVLVVINISGITSLVRSSDNILIDGYRNALFINPDAEKIAEINRKALSPIKPAALYELPETGKSKVLNIEANIAGPDDAKQAVLYGASGIGLLRTEFFYLTKESMPEIQEEVAFYDKIADVIGNKPLTIRLLDTGGDKKLPYLPYKKEINPQMGLRGVRFLLENKELFARQLKNIFQIKQLQNIKILIPFVTAKEDVIEAKNYIQKIIRTEKISGGDIPIGVMIETPSAALLIEDFIEYIDFISIGTNDLSQFLFAVSREEFNQEKYNFTAHPLLFRIISNICRVAEKHDREVSVCGEIASHPVYACILAGSGVRKLSVEPESIPEIHKALSGYDFQVYVNLADSILRTTSIKEITAVIQEYLNPE